MSIGFGVVGTGLIAGIHAKALSVSASAHLAACLSRSRSGSKRFAAAHSCIAHHELADFLSDPSVQAVSICSPSGLHLEAAEAAAAAGKHLLIEKPVEVTLERCDRILDAADAAGVTCAGVFQGRFLPDVRLLKEALELGRFGVHVGGAAIVNWYRSRSYYHDSSWHGNAALDGGGALMNQAIHTIDLLQWLMGPVATVEAFATVRGHDGLEVEDTAVAAVEFRSGALGVIQGTTAAYPGLERRIEISGTRGSAVLMGDALTEWHFEDEVVEDEALRARIAHRTPDRGGASDPAGVGFLGHQQQYEDLVDAIGAARAPAIDGREATRAVALVLAIYESARTCRRVEVSR